MDIREIKFSESNALKLEDFKSMDYYAVENYNLPIELMMENAGLALAKVIALSTTKENTINIGVGNGNNGGGGLVAARRLAAWGYRVHLDLMTEITRALPAIQLERAKAFGVIPEPMMETDVWVDAYLGFSQRLPLNESLLQRIEKVNKSNALKISLDLPTGFTGEPSGTHFQADKVLTLAAPKKMLLNLDEKVEIYLADLGIPHQVYKKFDLGIFPFEQSGILKLRRQDYE